MINRIFWSCILPVSAIISLSFAAYFVLTDPSRRSTEAFVKGTESHVKDIREQSELRISEIKEQTELRISENKDYEKSVYETMISEVQNEKNLLYIILTASFLIFLVLFLNLVRILTRLDPNILIFPDDYEVISKEEAEALNFIKYEMAKAKLITPDQPLMKKDCTKIIDIN